MPLFPEVPAQQPTLAPIPVISIGKLLTPIALPSYTKIQKSQGNKPYQQQCQGYQHQRSNFAGQNQWIGPIPLDSLNHTIASTSREFFPVWSNQVDLVTCRNEDASQALVAQRDFVFTNWQEAKDSSEEETFFSFQDEIHSFLEEMDVPTFEHQHETEPRIEESEDSFWDDLEGFCSSFDTEMTTSSQLNQEEQEEDLALLAEAINFEEQRHILEVLVLSPNQQSKGQVSSDGLILSPSSGFPSRHLAQTCSSPLGMLTPEHEVEHHEEDKVLFTHPPQMNKIQTWVSFFSLRIWEAFQQSVGWFSIFFSQLVFHRHEEYQTLVKKGSYFDKPVNGFVYPFHCRIVYIIILGSFQFFQLSKKCVCVHFAFPYGRNFVIQVVGVEYVILFKPSLCTQWTS